MIKALFALLIVFLLVVITEYLWRKKDISTEISRKVVHIGVASFVAFWPLFMSWHYIEIIATAFLVVIILSRRLEVFKSIHSVERKTWGEALFAAAILIMSITVHTDWIFAAALLHLGVADGLAALVGTHYGKDTVYKIFGHKKTLAGTMAFYSTSLVILTVTMVSWGGLPWYNLLWIPPIITLIENFAIKGTDDLFVPLSLAVILSVI